MIYFKSKYTSLKSHEIATGIIEGTFTAEQVIKEALDLAEKCNEELNCVTELLSSLALKKAREIDSNIKNNIKYDIKEYPLLGVPISIKNTMDVEGYDNSAGLVKFQNKPVATTSILIQSLMKAGGIPYCKTLSPQFSLSIETSNPIYGSSSNPYNIKYTPGGSSGGEAALISSGASLIGVGSDIGGSLRVPAHFCGIYTLKPTSNRLSTLGNNNLNPGFTAVKVSNGPMARDLEDLELFMKIAINSKPWEMDDTVYNKSYIDYPIKQKLRVGYYFTDGLLPSTPPIKRAIMMVVDKLRKDGHDVFEFIPMDIYNSARLGFKLLGSDRFQTVLKHLTKGEKIDGNIYPVIAINRLPSLIKFIIASILSLIGQDLMAETFYDNCWDGVSKLYELIAEKYNLITEVQSRWEMMMADGRAMDCILCPVTSLPAHLKNNHYKAVTSVRYTMVYNLVDLPAGVIPVSKVDSKIDRIDDNWFIENKVNTKCWVTKGYYNMYDADKMSGLPVGVQIITRKYEEEKLIAIMNLIDNLLKS